MRVKSLAQEHNTMSTARARTQTTRSGVERTNHEAIAPPLSHKTNPLLTARRRQAVLAGGSVFFFFKPRSGLLLCLRFFFFFSFVGY